MPLERYNSTKSAPKVGYYSMQHISRETDAPSDTSEAQNVVSDGRGSDAQDLSVGTWIFASFAVLSLIATAVRGLIPLDLLGVAFWAGLAWLCYARKIVGQTPRVLAGVLAVLVAFGEGYSIARHGTPSYKYLQMGSHQIRVDNAAGRTDQLWTTGWKPISFDRPASEMNLIDGLFTVPLSNGRWEGERICFNLQNKSDYVIRSVEVSVTVKPKSPADSPTKLSVLLRPEVFGLLDVGDDDSFCGTAGVFPDGAAWSYEAQKYMGWKR